MIQFLEFIPIFNRNGGLSMFGIEKGTGLMLRVKSIAITVILILTSIFFVQGFEEVLSVSLDDLVLYYDLNEGSGQNV